ncbi:MAG: hypothetical protein GEU87_06110 [Alphaproteobacteria bacterium]|nr:hypothetical protein [Alphaproteobacteria bacterium]
MKQARLLRKFSFTAVVAAGACLVAGTAAAQMYEQPYSPQARDRAGLAVYMKNLKESRRSEVTASGGGDATYLVCGGSGGQSTATANSSCVILNNSDASLGIGQGSDGDQGANASTNSTTNTTTADEVSNILNAK